MSPNAKVLVIANVSPETQFLGMTKDALEFVKEIAKIKDQHSDRMLLYDEIIADLFE